MKIKQTKLLESDMKTQFGRVSIDFAPKEYYVDEMNVNVEQPLKKREKRAAGGSGGGSGGGNESSERMQII